MNTQTIKEYDTITYICVQNHMVGVSCGIVTKVDKKSVVVSRKHRVPFTCIMGVN